MNRAELEGYAEVLTRTGLTFSRDELDRSGNRTALVEVPWEDVIIRVMRATGWRISLTTEDAPVSVMPLRLEP